MTGMDSKIGDIEIQRQYYAETAHVYNEMHVIEKDEHFFAMAFMLGALDYLEIKSVLDIGFRDR